MNLISPWRGRSCCSREKQDDGIAVVAEHSPEQPTRGSLASIRATLWTPQMCGLGGPWITSQANATLQIHSSRDADPCGASGMTR